MEAEGEVTTDEDDGSPSWSSRQSLVNVDASEMQQTAREAVHTHQCCCGQQIRGKIKTRSFDLKAADYIRKPCIRTA